MLDVSATFISWSSIDTALPSGARSRGRAWCGLPAAGPDCACMWLDAVNARPGDACASAAANGATSRGW